MKRNTLLALTLSLLFIGTAKANESEPNNDRDHANNLALNGSNTGKISPAGDQDWWKVTTTADGKLDITLTPGSVYVYVSLYDNDGSTQLNAMNGNTQFTLSTDGLSAGTYYIRVICYYNTDTSSYTLSNTLSSPLQANDLEPNGSRAQAQSLHQNGIITGHVNYYYNVARDTADWYKVTTAADGRLRLTLTSYNGKYINCWLYDNDGITQLNYQNTNTTADINTDGLAAGTYYIRVQSYYNSDFEPYSLADTLYTPAEANDSEPNGSRQQAQILPQNSNVTGHINYYYNNRRDTADWYRVTTTTDGMLQLKVISSNNKYINCWLYDNDGITQLNYQNTNSTVYINTDGLAAGTYFVRIQSYYNSDYSPYTIQDSILTYINAADTESNDAPYLAKTLPANGTFTGHVNFYYNNSRDAVDWWKINYTGTGSLTINVSNEAWLINSSQHYYWFQVYKDTATAPIFSQNFSAASSTVNLSSLSAGYYWVKIFPYYNSEYISYAINPVFTQVQSAQITLVSKHVVNSCNAANSLTYQCNGSKPPYSVQIYRFGVAYGGPITVANTNTFTVSNLPTGSYYATAFGDGATGNAFGTSTTAAMEPKPAGLSTSNIQPTQAKFNWTALPCVLGYKVQYRVQGTTAWTTKYTFNNYYTARSLAPATIYEWRVASADSANGFIAISAFSAISTFTTSAEPFVANAGTGSDLHMDRGNTNDGSLTVYPNPVNTSFTFQFNGDKGGFVDVFLEDMNGNVLWKGAKTPPNTRQKVEVDKWTAGTYLLIAYSDGEIVAVRKVIIQR